MTRKDDDLEAMIAATTTVTPGKGLKVTAAEGLARSEARMDAAERRLYAPFWPKVVDRLERLGWGILYTVAWFIDHAVTIAITWAMIAFGTYWAVATAYLIGANR